MPFNGSGTFQRTFPSGGWQGDATANIKIRADRHDQHDDDLAAGISNAICKDGQSSPTADIPMNGKKIINLGAPINPTDATTKGYVDGRFGQIFTITGTDDAGRIVFAGSQSPLATGKPLGISFTQADLFFGVKPTDVETVGKVNRWVWNNKGDGAGTDVANMTDAGAFTAVTVTATGTVTANGYFQSSSVSAVLGTTGAGGVYLRPNGVASAAGQSVVDSNGNLSVSGTIYATSHISTGGALSAASTITAASYEGGNFNNGQNPNFYVRANHFCKNGIAIAGGGYGPNVFNMLWNGSGMVLFVDNTVLGTVNTTPSDYRIKKDVEELPSTWDSVKALRPISYTQAGFSPVQSDATKAATEKAAHDIPDGPVFVADDVVRWGFIAHETQETLVPSAASGEKDMQDGVQGLNLAPILAATVKALQEAMARIEVLEARVNS